MSSLPSSRNSKHRRGGHGGGRLTGRVSVGSFRRWVRRPLCTGLVPVGSFRCWAQPLICAVPFRRRNLARPPYPFPPLSALLILNRPRFTHDLPFLAADREATVATSEAARARH
jgi:hypothetical protein